MNGFVLPMPLDLPTGVRSSRDNDLPMMTAIFNETAGTGSNSPVTRPMTLEEVTFYVNLYKEDGLPVYVIERAGEVVGWLSINRFSWGTQACARTGELAIYVRSDYHGRGLGVHLCRASMTLARHHGLETIVGWIMAANKPSQKIIQSVGARLWAHLPGIARFGEQRADVLLFGLPLDAASDKTPVTASSG